MLTTPDRSRPRLIAAPFTAFHSDGSLDLEAIPGQAAGLLADGVSGAFVCGTTGEGGSLTVEERIQVAGGWVKAAGDLDVIVHVGHACLADARRLAADAERIGVAGIAAVAPYYHRPVTVEDLVSCCAEIAAAAPNTPFFYYHIPSVTGVALPMDAFLAMAAERIPTFAGIKYTHDDLGEFARLLDIAGSQYAIMFGRDELLLPGLTLGASAAVGSTYNFAAPVYLALADALERGDLAAARAGQRVATRMIDIASAYGGAPALKALAGHLGRVAGPCRTPLRSPSQERFEELRAELDEDGFFTALETARATL